LIDVIRQSRGDLIVRESDFAGSTLGSRFYPTLYVLTRTQSARDFGTGLALSASLLGVNSSLDVHHIFPKAQLYKHGYPRSDVNAVANFCFLTKQSNLKISDSRPADYMPIVEDSQPGALASQWIPSDPALWDLTAFREFMAARRVALASATNVFLESLLTGGTAAQPNLERIAPATLDDAGDSTVAAGIDQLVAWLSEQGCAEPGRDVEVADPETGEYICTAEAFWPNGLQDGIGSPVVLELDELHAESALAALGYRVFTTIDTLRAFVSRQGDQPAE
jgi:hypothetical protein